VNDGDASSPVTVLIDDVRCFRDHRPARIARSSAAGVTLLRELQDARIDHLWLDHDLGGDDTIWPVVRFLTDESPGALATSIGLIHIHASRSGPAHEMSVSLRRCGYRVERSVALGMWTY
jgi:hypothetical protein